MVTSGKATWRCTDEHGYLWYIRLSEKRQGPYPNQREVRAIIDIADDGTLAGVEFIDDMPPPPKSL